MVVDTFATDLIPSLCPQSTFLLPLMSISHGAVKPWFRGFLQIAEQALSAVIDDPGSAPDPDMFANRALIQSRLGDAEMALEDAEKVTPY